MNQANLPPELPEQRLLDFAWQRHNVYSKNATRHRTRFSFLRNLLLGLSILVVVLSVTTASLNNLDLEALTNGNHSLKSRISSVIQAVQPTLENLLIILPITITALLAFALKFDRGNNWLLLRGSAEVLKSEIYCYRARVREYQGNRHEILARKIKIISERLRGSAVHQAALNPYEQERPSNYQLGWILKAIKLLINVVNSSLIKFWNYFFRIEKLAPQDTLQVDDGLSELKANDYLRYRLEDQFFWYRNKTQQLDRKLQFLEGSIYFFGGLGTFLAAMKWQSWVAVTVSLTGALSNYLDFQRVEATLVGYNRAADSLYDISTWWHSLSLEQQKNPKNYERLVVSTEAIIRSEHASWLQDMQDRLAEMYGNNDNETFPEIEKNAQSPSLVDP